MSKYYVKSSENDIGPLDLSELQSRGISFDTFVRPADAGEDAWVEATELPELAEQLTPAATEVEALTDLTEDPADFPILTDSQVHWGDITPKNCRGDGLRTYSAILWGIPFGQSWEQTCAITPATVAGIHFARPTRCVNTGTNIWGEWDVPDSRCGQQQHPSTDIPQCVLRDLWFGRSTYMENGTQHSALMVNSYIKRTDFLQADCRCPAVDFSHGLAARITAYDGSPSAPARGFWVFRNQRSSNEFSFGTQNTPGATQQIMPLFVPTVAISKPLFEFELFLKAPLASTSLSFGPGPYQLTSRRGVVVPPHRR